MIIILLIVTRSCKKEFKTASFDGNKKPSNRRSYMFLFCLFSVYFPSLIIIHVKLFCRIVSYRIVSTTKHQGRGNGGYIGIYTPQNQSTLKKLCVCSSLVTQDKFYIAFSANMKTTWPAWTHAGLSLSAGSTGAIDYTLSKPATLCQVL